MYENGGGERGRVLIIMQNELQEGESPRWECLQKNYRR